MVGHVLFVLPRTVARYCIINVIDVVSAMRMVEKRMEVGSVDA